MHSAEAEQIIAQAEAEAERLKEQAEAVMAATIKRREEKRRGLHKLKPALYKMLGIRLSSWQSELRQN